MSQDVGVNEKEMEWKKSRRRLLRGYAPLTIFVVAFALITVLVPSISREENVVTVHDGQAAAAAADGNAASTSTTLPGGAASGTGTPGPPATGSNSGSSPTGSATAGNGNGTTRSGGGAAVTGTTTACSGQALQIPGDPYSPPCVAFSGNNGGATYNGVTSSTITLAYRFPSDFASSNSTSSASGAGSFTATQAETESTINGLVTYFNDHFQFYGRKLKVVYFNGQGAQTTELQDEGQANAAADATTVAQQIHAFGDASVISLVYAEALAQQKEMNFGLQFVSQSDMESMAPYAWGPGTDCTFEMQQVMNFIDKQLAGKPATYAGGSLKGQTRKFAILAPENPEYQACANEAVSLAQAAGFPIADVLPYQLNENTLTAQDDNLVAKLANDQITSVILLTDPASPLFLTERAAQQNYVPEWIETGSYDIDEDSVAQLYDQTEWAHAYGISFMGPTLPTQATLGYAAYKSVASDEPAPLVNSIYEVFDELAIGIEMAGPNLTPTNFEAGIRAYPGSQAGASNAQFGTWLFPNNTFNAVRDSWVVSYNPNETSAENGGQGGYAVDSPRYAAGQYPSGSAPIPASFPISPTGS